MKILKKFFSTVKESWLTFWLGEPCPKHPGHRVREFDAESASGCAMLPNMCELCWEEWESKYASKIS